MMTSLEARLSGADPAFARELHEQLVQAQGEVKRQLLRGEPRNSIGSGNNRPTPLRRGSRSLAR